MPHARTGDTSIYYKTEGDAGGEPLILIAGLGSQLTAWPPALRRGLLERGFFIVRFDNRDAGRSTWFDQPVSSGRSQYLLSDMADDVIAVLDDLGLESAHVLGASMGGMVAQTVAIDHAGRVRRLISIMSTTGDPGVGQPHPEVVWVLTRPRVDDRSTAIEQGIAVSRALSSHAFGFDEAAVRAHVAVDYDRAYNPEGRARQLAAINASGDRTRALRDLDIPTVVIHGTDDPLIDVSGGRATAEAIPAAKLHLIPGMAHDLPGPLLDQLVDLVAGGSLTGRSD